MIPRNKVLTIHFDNQITLSELPSFRGAIAKAAGCENVLFHNHINDKYRYSYPLIQYKRIGGKAAIVCIGDGTEAISDFFNRTDFHINLGNRDLILKVESIKAENTLIQIWNDNEFSYVVRKYLPLNQQNYKTYSQTPGLIDKYAIIERCLTGNILSFAKGIGVFFDKKIKTDITKIANQHFYQYKNIHIMGFDIWFKSNVSLPNYIGLGKNVSLGFGMLNRNKDITDTQTNG